MIVILASRWDEHAHTLAQRWAAADARVMTPRDLSRPGWRQRPSSMQPEAQTAIIAGQLTPHRPITAVLNRLPSIAEEDLAHILPADRAYVTSEMEAFLISWLTRLPCPVLNRPHPNCLVGPAWSLEQWACLAAQAGLPVNPLHLPSPQEPSPNLTSITVVGTHCFGDPNPILQTHALRLAAAAKLDLLEVRFSGSSFSGLNLLPDLLDDSIAEATLHILHPSAKAPQ